MDDSNGSWGRSICFHAHQSKPKRVINYNIELYIKNKQRVFTKVKRSLTLDKQTNQNE